MASYRPRGGHSSQPQGYRPYQASQRDDFYDDRSRSRSPDRRQSSSHRRSPPHDISRTQPGPSQGEFHIRGRARSSDRRLETSYERRNRYYDEEPSRSYDDRHSPSPPPRGRRYYDRDQPRSPRTYRSRSRSRRHSSSEERPPSRGKPSKEVMMEGLAPHLTENDVR
ncbi:hypothetical protein CLCR_10872 [Cladophialophora carrionii]|uniref:Uncharacterized protein n=1 Tax=Cladophialophora carrionii TaxID=86049 RepID=A0A1C1CZ78_9EURO|nr:hypothetical protein CLCR_10872 [Cladophialophora carrionii]